MPVAGSVCAISSEYNEANKYCEKLLLIQGIPFKYLSYKRFLILFPILINDLIFAIESILPLNIIGSNL